MCFSSLAMDFDTGVDKVVSTIESQLRRMEELERDYNGSHREQEQNQSSRSSHTRAYADPIASKHLQPHTMRQVRTSKDPYDVKYRTHKQQQHQHDRDSSPLSNLETPEKSQKKFEYLYKKIKYLDGKLLSLQAENIALVRGSSSSSRSNHKNSMGVSTEAPALPSELPDTQIQDLKRQVQYLMDKDQRRTIEEKENKSRVNSRTLDVDFVFDGVYLKLKTQLQHLIKDVVVDLGLDQEHSQQLAVRQNVLETELQQLLEQQHQLQHTVQPHLQPVTGLRDLYREEIETILMSVSQRANEAIQLMERSLQENGSKSMKDKLTSLEDKLTQIHIDNEGTWNLLETRCSEAIKKADMATEESTFLAGVVHAQNEKINMLEAMIGALHNTGDLETLRVTIDQISAKVQKIAISSTEFQEECRRTIASLEGQVTPLVGARSAIEKILKEVDKKVQEDSNWVSQCNDALQTLGFRLRSMEHSLMHQGIAVDTPSEQPVPQVVTSRDLQTFGLNVSSIMQREFESKFDSLLAEKINESWGAQGFNTAIDDIRSEMFLVAGSLKETRGDLEKYRREHNQSLVDEIISYVNEVASKQGNEIQRSVSVIASAILALHDNREHDIQEASELAREIHHRFKLSPANSPKSSSRTPSLTSPSSSSSPRNPTNKRVTFKSEKDECLESSSADVDMVQDQQLGNSMSSSRKDFEDFVGALNVKKETHRQNFRQRLMI